MGTLYLVATPIGNLEDITLRALRVLGEVSLIAAEDTRLTGRMLHHFQITTPMISFHGDSPPEQADKVIAALATGDVAVVSDAGMPGISDPGGELVRRAVASGYPVIPIPGPSSVTAAAAASGAADRGYIFAGFLPRKSGARIRRLRELAGLGLPVILFESPNRVHQLLQDIVATVPKATVSAGREMTKLHEEWLRGTPSELLEKVQPRGEYTLVIEPGAETGPDISKADDALREALAAGHTVRDAVDHAIAATGLPRKQVYNRALEIAKEQ